MTSTEHAQERTKLSDLFKVEPPRAAGRGRSAQPDWRAGFITEPMLGFGTVCDATGKSKEEAIATSLLSLRQFLAEHTRVEGLSWRGETLLLFPSTGGWRYTVLHGGQIPQPRPHPDEPPQEGTRPLRAIPLYFQGPYPTREEAERRGRYQIADRAWDGLHRPPWEPGITEAPEDLVVHPDDRRDLAWTWSWQQLYFFWEAIVGSDTGHSMRVHQLAGDQRSQGIPGPWHEPTFQAGYRRYADEGYCPELPAGAEATLVASWGRTDDPQLLEILGARYAGACQERIRRGGL